MNATIPANQQAIDRVADIANNLRKQRDVLKPVVEFVTKLDVAKGLNPVELSNLIFLAKKALESAERLRS